MSKEVKITVRGQEMTTTEARALINEISQELARIDPVLSDTPVGQQIAVINDPRWYTETAQGGQGTLLCFRDNGAGWRGLILPWAGAAELVKFISHQMANAIAPAGATVVPGKDETNSTPNLH